VVHHLKADSIWLPLTYFDLWTVRLIGLLPDLNACVMCGRVLNGSRAYFHPLADGLLCADDKRLASTEICADSRAVAVEIFRLPLNRLDRTNWARSRGADLRRFLAQRIERHIERKLVTAAMLERV
jgi:DNA repair protein RecO (recombination protein O)